MSKAEKLSGFDFARLADVRAPVTSERDLYLQQPGALQYRHMVQIAGIKALSDMLQSKRPTRAEATEAHVNRMILQARRDYDALIADETAVANLRKETGDDA